MIDVYDFFCGCGGTSRGLADAGFNIVFGTDIDRDAAATFKRNFPSASFLQADIRKLQPHELGLPVRGRSRPVLFSGCAPCQPFSKQNGHTPRSSDPRRNLLQEFARFIEAIEPDFILVENVPGLQRVRRGRTPLAKFTKVLAKVGYFYDIGIVRASAFGVPQTRTRLILLASRHAPIKIPAPTQETSSTVREWIGHLAPIEAGETSERDPHHYSQRLSPLNLRRIRATLEGGGRENWPRSLKLDCHKTHAGHSDVYGRLAWDRPAAGLTTRCISYSNGRFGHPEQDRAISVREAACLQTFPRDYVFVGSATSKARQIGNAVPPLMAKRLAEAFIS